MEQPPFLYHESLLEDREDTLGGGLAAKLIQDQIHGAGEALSEVAQSHI